MIEKALKRTFSPEFLNRIDDVIIFNSLDEGAYQHDHRHHHERCAEAPEYPWLHPGTDRQLPRSSLQKKDMIQQFGARPLHRAIQKYLEDPLAEEILNQHIKEGDKVTADYSEEEKKIVFSIESAPAKKEESAPKE